jgi:hypothetical protein
MSRLFSRPLVAAILSAAWLFAASAARADERCTIAVKGDSPVAKACQTGGLKAAKDVMKKLKAEAKNKGMKNVDCDACHKGGGDYTLNKDARERFAEMVKLVSGSAAVR